MSKYGHKTGNWLEAIVNKLGGEEKAEAFLRGDTTVVPTVVAEIGEHYYNLQGYDGVPIWRTQKFPLWKKVRLGLHKNPEEYRKELESRGFEVHSDAAKILSKITVSQVERELDLVLLSVADLGLAFREKQPHSADYADICAEAFARGLELCPAEVGPALRLQYSNQPCGHIGHWVDIAMEAISNPHLNQPDWMDSFRVSRWRGGKFILNTARANPDQGFMGWDQLVFVRPK